MPLIPDAHLAELLASGKSQREVAEALNCSLSTVARRYKNPLLKALVLERRSQYISQLAGELIGSTFEAHRVLLDLATNGASEQVKMSASKCLLDEARHYQEIDGVAVRLSAIEKELELRRRQEQQFQPRALAS